jgi:REP element-mobilizing transposase RayT
LGADLIDSAAAKHFHTCHFELAAFPRRVRDLLFEADRAYRYVFMPEHVHLLISEPVSRKPAKVIQVFKQRLSRRMRGKRRARNGQPSLRFVGDGGPRRFWQRRYYDLNVYSRAKVMEKLQYMHSNPVRARLVQHPADWPWSSWCFYYRGAGLLKMDSRE